MRRQDNTVHLLKAVVVGFALLLASISLLLVSDKALDVTAVAGSIGVVLSISLLGLSALVARWRVESSAHTHSEIETSGEVGSIHAAAFEDIDSARDLDDLAAM